MASEDDPNNLRYAEYVLGVLDADARAAVAHEVATTDEAAAAVALWQRRLIPLADSLPDVVPSDSVWARVLQKLRLEESGAPGSVGIWGTRRPWQWLSLGAALVAACCLILLVRAPVRETPQVTRLDLLVSNIRQDNGLTDWTATLDRDRKQIVLVPAASLAVPTGRSTQLWLIPAGRAPISVGVFTPDHAVVLPLTSTLLSQLATTAALAVSYEPPGGSPTGQPTGPVIAKGAISAAPSPAA